MGFSPQQLPQDSCGGLAPYERLERQYREGGPDTGVLEQHPQPETVDFKLANFFQALAGAAS